MPHKKELIKKISNIVEKDYPKGRDFKYEYEQTLFGSKPRIEPDIQVFNDGALVCVVEIGYTRPEKLNKYYKLEIPDIRWYSKDGEPCQTKVVTKTVKTKRKFGKSGWYYVNVRDVTVCPDCYEETYSDLLEEVGGKKNFTEKNEEEVYLESIYCVDSLVWCDGGDVFGLGFCDKCGLPWYLDIGEIENALMMYDIDNWGRFYRESYTQHRNKKEVYANLSKRNEDYEYYKELIDVESSLYGCSFDNIAEYINEKYNLPQIESDSVYLAKYVFC